MRFSREILQKKLESFRQAGVIWSMAEFVIHDGTIVAETLEPS